jgi:Family of unknown function (DUF6922)
MAKEFDISSYECDCGHQSHFGINSVWALKDMSHSDRVRLCDSAPDEHTIVFYGGQMVDILCPHRDVRLAGPLPELLHPFFWEYDFSKLTWRQDRDLIVSRVLASGDWEAVRWLRAAMGDYALRDWIEAHHGRGLSPQRLRFWQVVLGIPRREVNRWLAEDRGQIWHDRVRR